MVQVRHGSATTTYAIRAAIQRSQASAAELSRSYGINPKTVLKWRKRATVEARTLVADNLSGCVHGPSLRENIDREARLMTNEAGDHVRLGNAWTTH